MEEDKKQEQPAKKTNTQKNNSKTKWVILILILLMLAGIGGTYWFMGKKYSDMKKQKDDQIGQLEQSKKDLEKQLAEAKSSAQDSEEEVEKPACSSPSVDDVENIEASITSGNTAALEGYMATKVNVILAASEGIGERTPAQAVSDITSFINGAGAWDFNLPEATIDSYAGAFYAQYFPEGAVVGKSASSKVISFSFDCNGKIKTVFLSSSADILTQ